MDDVKILIVEDELIEAKRLQLALTQKGYIVSAIAVSGEQALKCIETDYPHLILMDIHLSGKIDGVTTAKTIYRLYENNIPVIFVTEIGDQHIFNSAKESFPKNYITKPYTDDALFRAIELAIQSTEIIPGKLAKNMETKIDDGVFILTGENLYQKLFLKDIIYLKSNGVYTEIHYEGHNSDQDAFYTISFSSNHVIKRLEYDSLLKVHKSYYVNLNRIIGIKDAQIKLKGSKSSVPIGREYKSGLESKMKFLKHNSHYK